MYIVAKAAELTKLTKNKKSLAIGAWLRRAH